MDKTILSGDDKLGERTILGEEEREKETEVTPIGRGREKEK